MGSDTSVCYQLFLLYITISPLSSRSSSRIISRLHSGVIRGARPPVAMTVHFSPSSSSMRSISPSSEQAVEYMMPDFMQSTVLVPITFLGVSKAILGRCVR